MGAFKEGKTRKLNLTSPDVRECSTPATILNQTSRVPLPSSQKKSSKVDLDIRRLELEHERQLRQMDLDDRERHRVHEQALARITSDEKNQLDQPKNPPHQTDEERQQPVAPFAVWVYFPVGIRRQYQALVRAALNAEKAPMYSSDCEQWIEAYKTYNCVVQEFILQRDLPFITAQPFEWLQKLADKIDSHRHVHYWSDDDQDFMLVVLPELQRQLMKAFI